uniref:Trehalase n=1 Tax=Gongylonema pulchrum TaxID=637853 RepID=A0A183ENV1_9BILA
LIRVQHAFIVPGGRFIEYYYWDAYWIIKGLLISGLLENAWMMIDNFAQFGFVPNGGRIYYLRRSQPPFLIPMAYEYFEATKNRSFIKEKYEFRSIVVNNHTVYVYRTRSNVPRPESYGIDILNSLSVEPSKRQQFFQVFFFIFPLPLLL